MLHVDKAQYKKKFRQNTKAMFDRRGPEPESGAVLTLVPVLVSFEICGGITIRSIHANSMSGLQSTCQNRV